MDRLERSEINASNGKTLLVIPTYNECHNVKALLDEILAVGLNLDILFIDDSSPDGTGELLDDLSKQHPRVSVRHRPGKLGLGTAHQDGIRYAYEHGYQTLLTMDCDFTHAPADLPRLLEAAVDSDVVVGSRYLLRDSLRGWNPLRRFLTNFAHFLTRWLLQIRYDATGAFRAYRLDRLDPALFQLVASKGYAFFFESLFILDRNQTQIKEVSVALPPRTYGSSKMSLREAIRSGLQIFTLWAAEFADRGRFRIDRRPITLDPELIDPQGWNDYWARKQSATSVIYEVVAAIYRRTFIKPRLNREIKRQFAFPAALLHAGCGTGQVDESLAESARLTALDISPVALQIYGRNNPAAEAVVHGSILKLPFGDDSFDGIYNLGVMEHFTEEELLVILAEFHRVLNPQGRIVLFWPHAWATSVLVLNTIHWFFHRVLRHPIQLHPPEVSLLRSSRQISHWLQQSGFQLERYSFGPGDLLIQVVIVASKQASKSPDENVSPTGSSQDLSVRDGIPRNESFPGSPLSEPAPLE